KAKYLQQAQACSVPFLIKALDLNNQCDLNYKNANNKRLSIEIALMQIASFFLPEVDVKPADPTLIAPPTTVATPPAQPIKTDTVPIESHKPNESEPRPIEISVPQNSSQQPVKSKSTISLKSALAESSKPEVKEINLVESAKSITTEDMQHAWKSYSEIHSDDPAFLNVLNTSQVRLDGQTIEITLASQIQEAFLVEKKSDVMQYLRKALNNGSLQLKTAVSEMQVQNVLYTPGEKFAKLSEKNPELKRLREVLDLEIQY
ncbi:MAG: hypothetical protein LBU91_07110, partial [Bacteroidales bacterium]|nr:hypothetical protein [Bacteroidales bacterium]